MAASTESWMHPMKAIRRALSTMSISAIMLASGIMLCVITLCVALSLVLIANWFMRANESLAYAGDNTAAAEEVYAATLAYILSRSSGGQDASEVTERRAALMKAIGQAEIHTESDEERAVFEQLSTRISDALNNGGVVAYNDVSAPLQRFLQINLEQAATARANAVRLHSLAGTVAIVSALMMALGLAGIYLVIRIAVTQPLQRLREAIGRHVAGDVAVRVDPEGAKEITAATATFNELAEKVRLRKETMASTLATVAHDLKNPITAMRLALSLLTQSARSSGNEQMKRPLEAFTRQIARLERMVADFLDLSALESGQLTLRKSLVDLRECLIFVVDFLAESSAGHHVLKITPDQPVIVEADSVRVEQLLTNLLINAFKYAPKGQPVEVRLELDNGTATCSVSDHGPGIPAGQEESIFQGFVRLAATQSIPGFGLGLSGARRIAEAHNGTLQVDKSYQGGARFVFSIPLASTAT